MFTIWLHWEVFIDTSEQTTALTRHANMTSGDRSQLTDQQNFEPVCIYFWDIKGVAIVAVPKLLMAYSLLLLCEVTKNLPVPILKYKTT